jgi:hypothetical protein
MVSGQSECVGSCSLTPYLFDYFGECLEECPIGTYYYSDNHKYYCTSDLLCPEYKYKLLIPQKGICIDNCTNDDQYIYELNNICYEIPYYLNNKSMSPEISNNNITKDEIIENIKEYINNLDYNNLKETLSEMQNKNIQYLLYKDNEMNIVLTTSENQNKNINNKITTINLGECETKLKKEYNIPNENYLIIFKIDVLKDDMEIPQIEYEVYYPLNGSKLKKLDLSKCKDLKIELNIPIILRFSLFIILLE